MPWGVMLDSGHVVKQFPSRAAARAALVRWNAGRREYLARKEIISPRRAICLVRFKPKASPAAASLGSKGGKARAKKLSPARRSDIAKKAANARWGKGD